METTVNQRIIKLIAHLKISDRQFAKTTGIPETTLSTYVKRGTNPSSSALILILKAFPTISAKWLLLGNGEMINENEVQLRERKAPTLKAENKELIAVQNKLIEKMLQLDAVTTELYELKMQVLKSSKKPARNKTA